MLASSMNSSDLLRILSADHERIVRWGQYRIKEMRSELLRGMKDKIWKYFDYHTDNADYIIVIHCNRAGKFGIIRFAYIKETNEYLSKMQCVPGYSSISVHMLHRYAERVLKNKDLSIGETLLAFSQQNTSIVIYYDDTNFVAANGKGLVLMKYDTRRDIVCMKTFVSLDMLKESQYSAWEKVSEILKSKQEFKSFTAQRKGMTGEEKWKSLVDIDDKQVLSKQEAFELYATFYKE